jgi:hypothetical protein
MAKQTIKLKKYTDIVNEYVADATITPGMLVAVASDGKIDPQNVAGGVCEKMFALENELLGKTIADNYAAGDPVQCWIATPGEEVLAWILNGEDIAKGDKLVAGGGGKLKEYDPAASAAVVTEEYPIAVALEACDMSGSSGADPSGRCAVRIL